MKARLAVFVVALVSLFLTTAVILWRSWLQQRKNDSEDILELIAKLTPLDESRLKESANRSADEAIDRPATALAHIGSWNILLRNCEILAEVAEKIQVAYSEALLLAEELRHKTRAISWHLDRLEMLNNGGSEDWSSRYSETVVGLYLATADAFLHSCDAFSATLCEAVRKQVWV